MQITLGLDACCNRDLRNGNNSARLQLPAKTDTIVDDGKTIVSTGEERSVDGCYDISVHR